MDMDKVFINNDGRCMSGRQRIFLYLLLLVVCFMPCSFAAELNIGDNSVHTGVVVINGREMTPSHPGEVVVQHRKVQPFSSLDIAGGFDVNVYCGKSYGLSVKAEKRLQDKIKSTFVNGTLRIFPSGHISTSLPVKIAITAPSISSVLSNGANDLAVNCSGDSMKIDLAGSSEMRITGRASLLKATLEGSSELEAVRFKAADVHIVASGSASASVYASGSIIASATGASDIVYHGRPARIQVNADEASDIEAADD